jgi:hypothetical protein
VRLAVGDWPIALRLKRSHFEENEISEKPNEASKRLECAGYQGFIQWDSSRAAFLGSRGNFSFWGFFDLTFGKDRETIGTCFIDLADLLGIRPQHVELMRLLQPSRMGVYEHCGSKWWKYLQLRELLTGKVFKCICPAGYIGKRGELWYTRVLPPPFTSVDYGVVITTPYILMGHSKDEWIDFFGRHGIQKSDPQLHSGMTRFMKQGTSRDFWNEFVFAPYVNHRKAFILLEGIPDRPETLPHSHVSF